MFLSVLSKIKVGASICRGSVGWKAPERRMSMKMFTAQFPMGSASIQLCSSLRYLRWSAVLQETGTDGEGRTPGERRIADILVNKLSPSYIQVRDISGGCGSMYEIVIDSEQFQGRRLLQQHRMVNEALGEEIVKSLHGLTIRIGNPETTAKS